MQEKWRARTGQTPTQQELIGHLLDYAMRHAESIIDEASWRPLKEHEIEAVFQEAIDLGHPTDLAKDIDETVYDEEGEDRA